MDPPTDPPAAAPIDPPRPRAAPPRPPPRRHPRAETRPFVPLARPPAPPRRAAPPAPAMTPPPSGPAPRDGGAARWPHRQLLPVNDNRSGNHELQAPVALARGSAFELPVAMASVEAIVRAQPAPTPARQPNAASPANARFAPLAPFAAPATAMARGSLPSIAQPSVARRPSHRLGETIGLRLTQLSVVVVAATVTVAGVRMWREAKRPPPVLPSAVIGVGDGHGRVELSADRATLTRIDHGVPRWIAPQPRPLDEVSLAGALVLGRAGDTLAAMDRDTGRARFAWTLPAGERWTRSPTALGSCLLAITTRGGNALAHCVDVATGATAWTATIAGGRECVAPPLALPGAYLVQCPGFTTIIDAHDGTVSFDAGGLGIVQRDPPLLLRAGPHPVLAPWSQATKKFARKGTPLRGPLDGASSAVQHAGRIVLRAMSASDRIATLAATAAPPIVIGEPELQLADNMPLVLDCGGDDSPRFQLLELAPKVGATFDPAAAQYRVLALLDVEAGRVAWTSHRILPAGRAGAATPPICRHGHYFVPVEVGAGATALWIVDAERGATTAALAFDPDAGATFADLAADAIDRERIVGVDRTGVFELRWNPPRHLPGLHDARGELERVLGRLP